MSDHIGHECGLALVRLRKPLSYYRERYSDPAWGLRRLYLLMEKQHNRGQDGAGVAAVKLDMPPGEKYLVRVRSVKHNALERIFDVVTEDLTAKRLRRTSNDDDRTVKHRFQFVGELYLGHLRYGTHAGNTRSYCHPLVRKNNVASRNLGIAGNFNMTNSRELFEQLVEYGLTLTGDSDTQVILERLGYFLDSEHDYLETVAGPESFRGLRGRELAEEVSRELDLVRVMRKASVGWDGGYVFAGILGNGDAFACRDPAGIRPGFMHVDDEVVAVASERAALANVFNIAPEEVEAIRPGHVLVVKHDGTVRHEEFTPPTETRQCTFERIYFSRGNDPDIYRERKSLGKSLAPRVLEAINHDVPHAVFSFIPNTAETAFVGLLEELDLLHRQHATDDLRRKVEAGTAVPADVDVLLNGHIRAEKIAHKDQRLRTFITHDSARSDLVMHIYDITRGVVRAEDTLVVLDDSIVRGTTLRESIIKILSRLEPARIVIVSSAPPIMYPDCYGIDMSQLGRFVAFEAGVSLLRDRGDEALLDEIEARCIEQSTLPAARMKNHVGAIYERFTLDELSAKVAELVRPSDISWTGPLDVIYQSIDGLRAATPEHTGDWYFTGRYPTPGGYEVLNRSFLNWRESLDVRAY
jgi:amidophosphoribosyltransferase